MKWPHIQDFLWQHPSYFLCEGQDLSEKCKRVAFLTLSILLEGTEVKLCPLEMTEWPWWEPSGSMIPLQIDLWCHSIKGWGTFPCAPTNYGRWRAECKASSLLSWMAHTSSSSLGMCPESDGFFFSYFCYSAKYCFHTFGKLWMLNHNRNSPYIIHFSKQNSLET